MSTSSTPTASVRRLHGQGEDRYIAAVARADSAADRVYGFNLTRKEFFRISLHSYAALRYCSSFRTLGEHAEDLAASAFSAGGLGSARAALSSLCDEGLLVSEQEVATHLSRTGPPASPEAKVPRIYIPTANRPETTARCILSHLSSTPVGTELCIVDDSEEDPTSTLTSRLRGLAPNERNRVFVATRDRREHYLRDLAQKAGLESEFRDAIPSALVNAYGIRESYGVTRNLVLLDGAGELLVSADDDTLSETTVLPPPAEGFRLSSAEDPTDISVYDSFSDLQLYHELGPTDLVETHTSILGALTESSMHVASVGSLGDGARPDLVRRVMSQDDLVVRATSLGMAGDPGRAGLQFLLEADAPRRQRFFDSAQHLERALLSESVVRHASQTSIGDSGHFMTTHIGLDNRRPLPPFFPVGRVVDAVFAQMLLTLDSRALVAHLPAAVRHERPGSRNVDMVWITQVAPSISMYVGLVFQEFRRIPGTATMDDELVRAGAFFTYLGRLSRRDLADLLKLHWNRLLAGRIDMYLDLLQTHDGEPAFWADIVEKLIINLEEQLSAPGFPVPVELSGLPDFERVMEALSRLLEDYGRLLYVWPQLWSAAKELRTEGRGLVRSLFAE